MYLLWINPQNVIRNEAILFLMAAIREIHCQGAVAQDIVSFEGANQQTPE